MVAGRDLVAWEVGGSPVVNAGTVPPGTTASHTPVCNTMPPCKCPLKLHRLHPLQVLQAHLELPRCILGDASVDYPSAAALLQHFASKQELR